MYLFKVLTKVSCNNSSYTSYLVHTQGRSKPQKDGQASPANLDIASSVCKAHSACNAC